MKRTLDEPGQVGLHFVNAAGLEVTSQPQEVQPLNLPIHGVAFSTVCPQLTACHQSAMALSYAWPRLPTP